MRLILAILILCATAPAAQAQMNILGPCRDGHRWLATRSSGDPVAAYATCEGNLPIAIVACGFRGWPELRIAAAPGTRVPPPGESGIARMTIDGTTSFDLRLSPGASIAGGNTILRVQLTQQSVEAMARGFTAVLDMNGTRLEMHLGASNDVLMLFNQQC
jgi:hypothetical protein